MAQTFGSRSSATRSSSRISVVVADRTVIRRSTGCACGIIGTDGGFCDTPVVGSLETENAVYGIGAATDEGNELASGG